MVGNITPNLEDIQTFWRNVWENPATHKKMAHWLKLEKKKMEKIPYMSFNGITKDEVKQILAGAPNWKSAGPDKIQNFWYKKLTCTHEKISKMLTEC